MDSTLCPIQIGKQDWNYQKLYYSKKHGTHGLKYEITVSSIGKIYWIAGGVLGSVHDLTLARSCELLETIMNGENIYADKAYQFLL